MCRCTLGNTAMPTSGPLWLLRSRPMSLIMHAGLTSACSSKLVKVVRISSFCLLGSTLVSVLVGFFRSFYLHLPATVAESSCEWLPALPFWFGSLSDVFIPYFISPHHPKYSTVPFMVRSLQSFGIYAGHAPYFCIISQCWEDQSFLQSYHDLYTNLFVLSYTAEFQICHRLSLFLP